MYSRLLVFACLFCAGFFSAKSIHAQTDSLRVIQEMPSDTIKIKRLDPRKALLYSAAFPGLGQLYNKKYWKMPLVYGGLAVGIGVADFYQKNYVKFRDDLYIFLATGNAPSGRSETNLRYIVNRARRQRDYTVIMTVVGYLLQMVDAHVDAHLEEFKLNKEMKISLQPSIEQNNLIGRTTGFLITYKF